MNDIATCAVALMVKLLGVGPQTDSVRYSQIAEGRGMNASYGWCGDAVTACLMWAGCRDGNILNREELNGIWVPGDNLQRIIRYAKKAGTWVPASNAAPPVPYAVFFKSTNNGDHTGFVTSVRDREFSTIDGNSVGGVVARNNRIWDEKSYRGWVKPETFGPFALKASALLVGEPDPNRMDALFEGGG